MMTPRGSGSSQICLCLSLPLKPAFPGKSHPYIIPDQALATEPPSCLPWDSGFKKQRRGRRNKKIHQPRKSANKQAKTPESQMPLSMLLPGCARLLLRLRTVGARVHVRHSSGHSLEAEGNLSAGIATRHYINEIYTSR